MSPSRVGWNGPHSMPCGMASVDREGSEIPARPAHFAASWACVSMVWMMAGEGAKAQRSSAYVRVLFTELAKWYPDPGTTSIAQMITSITRLKRIGLRGQLCFTPLKQGI